MSRLLRKFFVGAALATMADTEHMGCAECRRRRWAAFAFLRSCQHSGVPIFTD